jgi:hypothetical protein
MSEGRIGLYIIAGVILLVAVTLAAITVSRPHLTLHRRGPEVVPAQYDSVAAEFTCPVDFEIAAEGGYPWQHTELLGGSWRALGQSGELTKVDVVDWFGSDRVHAGNRIVARRQVKANNKSTEGSVTLRYKLPSGELKSLALPWACVPLPADYTHYLNHRPRPARLTPMDTMPMDTTMVW